MWQIVGFLLHVLAIYAAAQLAQTPGLDVWRCLGTGCLSYIAMLALISTALAFLPAGGLSALVWQALLVGGATALAARIVLAASWRAAAVIGAGVIVTHALFSLLAGSTPVLLPPGCGG